MIYKIFILITALFLTINTSFAVQSGEVEYNSVLFDYSKLDFAKIQKEADTYFALAKKSNTPESREQYFNDASGKYYILTKVDNTKIQPYIQLGRIYDEKNKPRLAKENFCKAININYKDPTANYYFGEFFYKRNEYKKALHHFNVAYDNGLRNNYTLNLKLATIYEKFADLSNAKKFYDVSYSMRPSTELQNKIRSLDEQEYSQSGYYRE
jgi:hypothetical protein